MACCVFFWANVILEGFSATPCCVGIWPSVGRRRHGSFRFYSYSARIVKLNSNFFASRRCFGGRTLNPLRDLTFVVSESVFVDQDSQRMCTGIC